MITAGGRGLRTAYDLEGDERLPVVALCHSLGTNRRLWDPQMPGLLRHFRVLRYDVRGHGATDVPPGPYTIESFAEDFLSLLDALSIERAHFCGVSLGGFIGQWLGANAPERIGALVLANTAARSGTAEGWNDRVAQVCQNGLQCIEAASLGRWFTADFMARDSATIDRVRRMLLSTPVDGYAATCEAIRDMDLRPLAPMIARPTLVISGASDASTPPSDAAWLADAIPRAEHLMLPAAHLANLEAAEEFTEAVIDFLSKSGD
jgi:3-oxoadipate enol-lactonase